MKEKKYIIIWIIVGIVITFIGVSLYEYIDDKIWEKEYDARNITDNMLTVECEKDIELENTIACMISPKDKSKTYSTLSVSVTHNSNIKYFLHKIPMPGKQYNSYNITEATYGIREHYYISDYDTWNKDGAALKVLYTIKSSEALDEDILTFENMHIEEENGITHITDKDININLSNLLNN